MMKLIVFLLCVSATTAWGFERHVIQPLADRLELNVTTVTPLSRLSRMLSAPTPIASHTLLRLDDVLAKSQQQLETVLDSAQHLGSRYRTFWITPSIGSVTGASIRFNFK